VRFAHALIREAVYAGITPLRRRQLHRRAAEVLAATHSPDTDTVAYHFQQVGDPRAVPWLIAAGDRAQDAYAWPTAVQRFESALSRLEATEESAGQRGWLLYRIARLVRNTNAQQGIAYLDEASRLAAATGDDALAAGVSFSRGECRCLRGDYEHGLPALTAGVEAIEALAPVARARLNAHSDIGDFAFVRGTLALWLRGAGRYAEAETVGERLLADHPAAEVDGTRWGSAYIDVFGALFGTYLMLGKVEAARHMDDRVRAVSRELGNYFRLAFTMTMAVRSLLVVYETERTAERHALAEEAAQIWCRVGGITEAEAAYVASEPLLRLEGRWRELNTPIPRGRESSLAFVWVPIEQAIVAREQGDAERAWATIQRLLPDGPRTPFGTRPLDIALCLGQLAVALSCDGDDLATARVWLDAHDRWLEWSGAVWGRSEGQALWARYHRLASDPEQVRIHADLALTHATEPRQPLALLQAHRLLGELDTEAGRYDAAASHLNTSLDLANACAAPYERALTLLALAELYAATGEQDDALQLLDEVCRICTSLGARSTLARAATLAERIAAVPPAVPAYPAGLSAREVAVLRLVAQGLTNPQVAERLFLSRRTVEQHLRNIYNKLGVSTRAAATAFAYKHQLAGQ
jgi:DNA-binding CsgD family transcriptional regulator